MNEWVSRLQFRRLIRCCFPPKTLNLIPSDLRRTVVRRGHLLGDLLVRSNARKYSILLLFFKQLSLIVNVDTHISCSGIQYFWIYSYCRPFLWVPPRSIDLLLLRLEKIQRTCVTRTRARRVVMIGLSTAVLCSSQSYLSSDPVEYSSCSCE